MVIVVKAKNHQSDRHWPVPLKMLLDNELFIPKAWLRFIPNPDMLQRLKFNRRLTFILSICKCKCRRTDTDLYNDVEDRYEKICNFCTMHQPVYCEGLTCWLLFGHADDTGRATVGAAQPWAAHAIGPAAHPDALTDLRVIQHVPVHWQRPSV